MSVYDTQAERGLPRYDANRDPWPGTSLYFSCGDCGGPLRPGLRQGFRRPEEPMPPPLRKIAWDQVVVFGRSLCRDCCRRALAARNITDPDVIRKLTP